MTEEEMLAEFERRLRAEDPGAVREGDVVLLHRWGGEPQDPPLQLHVTAEQLGRACRVDEETRDALWPSASVEVSGLNLLLAHLDEEITVALDAAPERCHVVGHPRVAVLTDPDVLGEDPPRLPSLDLPPGEYEWVAPLSGARFPADRDDAPPTDPAPR